MAIAPFPLGPLAIGVDPFDTFAPVALTLDRFATGCMLPAPPFEPIAFEALNAPAP